MDPRAVSTSPPSWPGLLCGVLPPLLAAGERAALFLCFPVSSDATKAVNHCRGRGLPSDAEGRDECPLWVLSQYWMRDFPEVFKKRALCGSVAHLLPFSLCTCRTPTALAGAGEQRGNGISSVFRFKFHHKMEIYLET